MGYCGRCGKSVTDEIVGYDTQTGKPKYHTPLCGGCSEKISEAFAAHIRNGYERELKEIGDMRNADMINIRTAEFMKKRLKERLKEFWE